MIPERNLVIVTTAWTIFRRCVVSPGCASLECPEHAVLDVHPGEHEVDLAGLIYFFEKHLQSNRFLGAVY